MVALTAILVVFFSDHGFALILGRAIGIFGVPFLFGLGWRYVWDDFVDPVKFLAYWCSAAQFVSLITNLVRVPQSSWGVSGAIMIFATATLMVAYIMGYFRSWRGNVATIGIIILNLVATFWLILNNLENVNLWMIGDYPDEGLSLLGGIITDIGLLNPFTSLAPQTFMLDLDTRIREYKFYSNMMEPNETERQLTHMREEGITQRPEAQQETVRSPPKNRLSNTYEVYKMRLREFLTGPLTPRSLLVILLLVGGATAVNLLLNPPPQHVETEAPEMWFYEYIESLTFDNYTRYDIDYWCPEGMTLEELGNTSYYEGGLHGHDDPNVLSGEFFLVWKPSGYFDGWEEALGYIIQLTGEGITDGNKVWEIELSYPIHPYVYTVINGTDTSTDKYVGMFETHDCPDTERVFVYLYINFGEFNIGDYKLNGQVYSLTYICHPISGTPIDHISFG
jgi:hypothetical protein